MTDPETPPVDPTLIARFENWHIEGDTIPKLALHLHGDEAARAQADELVRQISNLNASVRLTLDQLDQRVREISESLGLSGYAVDPARCVYDPLHTVVDVSVFTPDTPR
jgi:hypothetical protein